MSMEEEDPVTERLFISVFEPLDLATDVLWIYMAVDTGPFVRMAEFGLINGFAWAFLVLNLARFLNARRSRAGILSAGLEGSHGARLREVVYAAQQVVWEDVPTIVLAGYVAARLVVAGTFNQYWPAASLVTILLSEVSFVKFGRAISRAGFVPGRDPIAPLLLLAFVPPGLRDASTYSASGPGGGRGLPEAPDGRLFGVARRFNDKGDDSIEDINRLLGSQWF